VCQPPFRCFLAVLDSGRNPEFEKELGDGYAVIQELTARGRHCHIYDDSVSKRAGKRLTSFL
jgi:hypothetical protein